MKTMIFYSLQGLGNSIINAPLLCNLRSTYRVKVVCFNNGSSTFFRAFHNDVVEVTSRASLIKACIKLKADISFVPFPTWRREYSAAILSRSKKTFFLPHYDSRWAHWAWPSLIPAKKNIHHLDNNIPLAELALNGKKFDLDLSSQLFPNAYQKRDESVLAVHPTASTIHKYYPLKFWQDLLSDLASSFEKIKIFCGPKPEEHTFCEQIRNSLTSETRSKVQIFANQNFIDLAKNLASASSFVGSDSSLMHLSALLDRPTVGLWSFANYKIIYPYGNSTQVYIPEETIHSSIHEYPNQTPSYMDRANPMSVAEIVRNQKNPDFEMTPKYKKSVRFYIY